MSIIYQGVKETETRRCGKWWAIVKELSLFFSVSRLHSILRDATVELVRQQQDEEKSRNISPAYFMMLIFISVKPIWEWAKKTRRIARISRDEFIFLHFDSNDSKNEIRIPFFNYSRFRDALVGVKREKLLIFGSDLVWFRSAELKIVSPKKETLKLNHGGWRSPEKGELSLTFISAGRRYYYLESAIPLRKNKFTLTHTFSPIINFLLSALLCSISLRQRLLRC